MGFSGEYLGGSGATAMEQKSASSRQFTLNDRIKGAISESEQRLAAAKRADEILQQNPQLEELLNLLQRF